MKRIILGAILALVLASGAASAQQWIAGACAKCYMTSYVDAPADGDTVAASGFYVGGWGFICEGGAAADRVDVWYQQDDGFWVPLKQSYNLNFGHYRPDVQAAYQAHCPSATSHAGWGLWVSNTPPAGTRQVAFNVWRGPYYETHYRTVTVVETSGDSVRVGSVSHRSR